MRRYSSSAIVTTAILVMLSVACQSCKTWLPAPPVRSDVEPTNAPQSPPLFTKPSDVVILVVDDFTPPPTPSSQDVPATPADAGRSCTITPEGEAYGHTGASTGLPLGVSHGQVVFEEYEWLITKKLGLSQSVTSTGTTYFGSAASADAQNQVQEIEEFTDANRTVTVTLAQVGISYMQTYTSDQTDPVSDKMSAALAAFKKHGQDQIVVNLSFAIVPCKTLGLLNTNGKIAAADNLSQTYKAGQDAAYVQYNLIKGGEPGIQRMRGKLLKLFDPTDPTYSGNKLIIVAASGNWDLRFPFAPALWNGVLAVSASADSRKDEPKFIPNDGDVTADGRHPTRRDSNKMLFVGTSFAAPRVGVLAAWYMLNGGNAACIPPMKSAGLDNPHWQNLPLATAIARYCSSVLPPPDMSGIEGAP